MLIIYMQQAGAVHKKKNGSGGCPGASAGHFPFPGILGEYHTVIVTWKTQALTCPPASTLVYYDNTTTLYDFTLSDQDELIVSYAKLDMFIRETRNYCLEEDGEEYRVAVCQPDPTITCGNKLCIPKCCGEGEVIEDFYCTRMNESAPLQFYSFYGEPVTTPPSFLTVGERVPDCKAKDAISNIVSKKANLLIDGRLWDSELQVFYDFDEYCIDIFHEAEEVNQIAVACIPRESRPVSITNYLMKIGYIISDAFLIITILIHALTPSLRDTQGLILISHMMSMLVALTTLFVMSIFTRSISSTLCVVTGFVFQYSFLAMFFWLNIMCFDIWRVIRATARGIPLLGILSDDTKKFQLYCLYGWGSPLVISIVTVIMHLLPEEFARDITRPGFGKISCWLPGDMEHLFYCYAYVAALFILDLFFIGHTIYMLYQAGNAFMCFARQVSGTAFNRKHLDEFWQRFGVFILMVSLWTTEILSWKIPPREIWVVTDFMNSLQGFVIFVIFISSKKRRELVKQLLKKVTICCSRSSSQERPSIDNQVASWHVNTHSTSLSGRSTSTEEEFCSKTEE